MRLVLVAFALGCALLQVQPALPGMGALGVAGAVALGCAGIAARAPGGWRAALPAIACAALTGAIWAAGFAQVRLADALPDTWEGRDIELAGVIASLPQHFERGVRFEFTPDTVLTRGATVPSRIMLAWYGGFGADALLPVPAVHPGERWQFTVRLKKPHGNANPHGFDYEAWLLERGIRATGYVRPQRNDSAQRVLAPFVWSVGTVIDRIREAIRERLQNALADQPYAGVIIALAVGDQRAIDSDDWALFTRTGVGHLMSISGLHVTMIASLAAFVTFALWRRSVRLMLWLPAPRAAALGGLAAALAYCALAGFAVPAQRTLYMLGVAAWALWHGWFGSGTRVLAIALALVCLIDPWAPLSPGFWLSFGAVAMLLLAGTTSAARMHWFKGALLAQVAVTLGLVPLTLALFQQISLAGPLANAVAIPLVSFVVTPLALLASALPLDLPALGAHLVLEWLMRYLEWLGGFEWAVWQRAAPPLWTVLLAAAGTVWCLIPWWLHWRALGAIWILPLIVHPPPRPEPGDAWIATLDVGQGLAVVVRTAHHTLLFDTGPQYTPEADSGNRVIVPYLRGEGVTRLDGMVVSHDDLDHSGGALSMLRAMPVAWLASPLAPAHVIAATASAARRCERGKAWIWDDVHFELLHPPAADYERLDTLKDNSRSCVLAITAHGRRALLTADIERDVEARLLTAADLSLKSELLVVPHHGSKTSSTAEFIAAVAPSIAVVPVGYRNRFRHPAPEVIERYRQSGAQVLRTDQSGAVTARIGASGIAMESWRGVRPRYWQGR